MLAKFSVKKPLTVLVAVILVLITMLVSLLNWLHSDILQSISLFQTMI